MEPARNLLDIRSLLPDFFGHWFASRGWQPHAHQLELLAKARAGRSALLIAPTGGGKTLAGFLPTLVELYEASQKKQTVRRTPTTPSPLEGEGWGGGYAAGTVPAALPPSRTALRSDLPLKGGGEGSDLGGGEKKKLISTGR